MHVVSGVYSSSIMDLDPMGHDSSLIDKNQALGENLVKLTCAARVLQEVLLLLQQVMFWR